MPFPLWVAAGSFLLAGVAVLAIVAPRWLLVFPVTAAVVLPTHAVLAAETPLGIGDGVVPDVRGRESCDAYTALDERGLRWISFGRLHEDVPPGVCDEEDHDQGTGSSYAYIGDVTIVEQRPEPGTDIGEGGVVRLVRACEQTGECSPDRLRPGG